MKYSTLKNQKGPRLITVIIEMIKLLGREDAILGADVIQADELLRLGSYVR